MKQTTNVFDLKGSFGSFRIDNFAWYDSWVYRDGTEILDDKPGSPEAADVVRDLDTLARIGKLDKSLANFILPFLIDRAQNLNRPVRVLEVCCGNGWFIRHLQRSLSFDAKEIELSATDLSSQTIEIAKSYKEGDGIEWSVADALNLPFEDDSFDICINLQSLHHFSPESSVTLLSEMNRVGETVFLFDLRRTAYGFPAMQLLRPFFSKSFIHDAVVSHRRAFSVPEARWLIANSAPDLQVSKLTPLGMAIHSTALITAQDKSGNTAITLNSKSELDDQ